MNSNTVKTTSKTHRIEPTENKTDNFVHNTNEEANKDLYYFSNKEKCARCKQQGVFICEHKTDVRDDLKQIYAEEGRYYHLPRKSLRSENNGSSPHSNSNSAHMSTANDKILSNGKLSNGKTSNTNGNSKNINAHTNTNANGEKNGNLASKKKSEKEVGINENKNQTSQVPQVKKKDDGCCLIS